MKNLLLLIFTLALFTTCKKAEPEDHLPPATQTGAGTFGCKINGKVFVPKGYDGTGRPNPHIIYDIGLNGLPYLFIETDQYSNAGSIAGVDVSFFELTNIGNYYFLDKFRLSVGSSSTLTNCGIGAIDSTIERWGG